MGIQDFGTLIKEEAIATHTTTLSLLLLSDPDKNTIGVDMSIILIRLIKAHPSIIELLFAEPQQPIDDLIRKTCEALNLYVKHGFKVVCVFDGMSGPLKENHAHQGRYGKNKEKRLRLFELYKIESFECLADEKKAMKEVKALRKCLAGFNRSDLLFNLVKAIYENFGKNVVCVGAPFESDHQLASLYMQNTIDYVATIDSDLIVLGTNVIKVNQDGSCILHKFKESLSTCLPNKFGRKGKRWEKELLHHCGCFLGNDFLGRNPGNSVKHLSEFIRNITTENGMLKDEKSIYDYILSEALLPTHCSSEIKQKWQDNNYKVAHIRKWKEAMGMFSYGPAFIVKPLNDDVSPRESLWNGNFSVELAPMSGDSSIVWKIAPLHLTDCDKMCGRAFLFGFDPEEEIRGKLFLRDDYKTNNQQEYNNLLMKLFRLEVWSKTGRDVSPLPDLVDANGNELFQGSVLHFDKVPHWCYSADRLKVFLLSRQIKVPDTVTEIRNRALCVAKFLGSTHKPIPKAMMRGASGYLSVEVLTLKDNLVNASYVKEDEALTVINNSFPELTEKTFDHFFGKRNNTRQRSLMHLFGGSYNPKQLKITKDVVLKAQPMKNIILIAIGCSPSMKLKEKNKEKFYEVQLALEVNEIGEFMSILPHPYTTCECPVGCISCAHLGGFVLLLNALKNVNKVQDNLTPIKHSFDSIRNFLPHPVNDLLTRPMFVTYAFPKNGSDEKESSNAYKKMRKNKRYSITTPDEDIEDEDMATAEEDVATDFHEYAFGDVIEASDSPTTPVVEKSLSWLQDRMQGRDANGESVKTTDKINDALVAEAEKKSSTLYTLKKLKVQDICLNKLFQRATFKNPGREENTCLPGKLNMLAHPEPIIVPVLLATEERRQTLLEEYAKTYDLSKIRLDKPVNEMNESELLLATNDLE